MNLVWFRNDLRVDDNPALFHAMQEDTSVLACYLMYPEQWSQYGIGNNHQALTIKATSNLREKLNKLNVSFCVIDAGHYSNTVTLLSKICRTFKVEKLFFNIEYSYDERIRDKSVVEQLEGKVECIRYDSQSLVSPWLIKNKSEQGYKVFSAFARQVHKFLDESPVQTLKPPKAKPSSNLVKSESYIERDNLLDIKMTAESLPDIEESRVHRLIDSFCETKIRDYKNNRDIPAIDGTSSLSIPLALGVVSVKRCYKRAKKNVSTGTNTWVNELIWRDFYRAVQWHYSHVCKGLAFKPVDKSICWNMSQNTLSAWQKGETGVPIIDAAMKQLLTTGWMHNRLRMIVASFLTKNLFLDWRLGEAFFALHLFDYDFASNNGGWQWCASVGTDSAPYFRVFNPASQQKKFDPNADFIKHWLPTLAHLDCPTIHQFEKRPLANYPSLMVDLKSSRNEAIAHFKHAQNFSR